MPFNQSQGPKKMHSMPYQDFDERSPLIHGTNGDDGGSQNDASGETTRGSGLGPSSAIWIMSSVWLGTFLAGLGM